MFKPNQGKIYKCNIVDEIDVQKNEAAPSTYGKAQKNIKSEEPAIHSTKTKTKTKNNPFQAERIKRNRDRSVLYKTSKSKFDQLPNKLKLDTLQFLEQEHQNELLYREHQTLNDKFTLYPNLMNDRYRALNKLDLNPNKELKHLSTKEIQDHMNKIQLEIKRIQK